MASFSPYGKEIKKRLIDLGESQEWLMQKVREETGLYLDSSYMYKIQTGKLSPSKITSAINRILGINEED